jgi:hypothetical protein
MESFAFVMFPSTQNLGVLSQAQSAITVAQMAMLIFFIWFNIKF